MRKKLCYVISDIDTSHLVDGNVRFIDSEKFDLTTIFLAPQKPGLFETLEADGYDVRYIHCRGKKDLPRATWKLIQYFADERPDIVHTHLFNASIAGLTAARLKRIRARINTRHHSIEAHLYHPHAVWYDRYVNKLSTHIVAISDLVAQVLVETEKVPARKVSVIHHGFDMKRFDAALTEPGDLKAKYGLEGVYPIIGVVSRFIHWKGIQYIIPAFKKLLQKYPDATLVLANAEGSYEPEVRRLLSELDETSYRIIPFERDVLALYKSFDVFVHVPIGKNYEAFGQVYVEALAMKLPSVFTLSGIANDFIEDEENALVVPFEDDASIYASLLRILDDGELRERIVENGNRSAKSEFGVERMIAKLEQLYAEI